MQKKGFIVFSSLFTIIFLVGAGCAQVQSNTNAEVTTVNETAQETENDFSVYQSDKMKVSFKYPADWSIVEEYVDGYTWRQGDDGAGAWVKFSDAAGKEIIFVRVKNQTIIDEILGDSEIEQTIEEENIIEGYTSAKVASHNLFTNQQMKDIWFEKEDDLIMIRSFDSYPEAEHIIESLQFTK